MVYPTQDDRTRPSELPQGPYGYEGSRPEMDVPSGRSVFVMLGVVFAIVVLIALFSWTGTDTTTTSSTTPAPIEQTQPATPAPAPATPPAQ